MKSALFIHVSREWPARPSTVDGHSVTALTLSHSSPPHKRRRGGRCCGCGSGARGKRPAPDPIDRVERAPCALAPVPTARRAERRRPFGTAAGCSSRGSWSAAVCAPARTTRPTLGTHQRCSERTTGATLQCNVYSGRRVCQHSRTLLSNNSSLSTWSARATFSAMSGCGRRCPASARSKLRRETPAIRATLLTLSLRITSSARPG